MRALISLLALALSLSSSRAGEAAANQTGGDPLKEVSDRVMTFLSEGETNTTVAELFRPYWPFTGTNAAKGTQLATDMQYALFQAEANLGRRLYGRQEFLGAKRVGGTLVTYYYVQKFERAGMLFAFNFYKGREGWLLNSANWTSDPRAEPALWARENNPPPGEFEPVKQAIDKSLGAWTEGQTNALFADLFRRCWPVREAAMLKAQSFATEIQASTKQLEPNLGRRLPGSFEFLGARHLGNSYYTLVYVVKHENGGVPMAFGFYQSPYGWLLNDASFADSAQSDFNAIALVEPGK
jgi:hypothetical protein